jgi:hypothetical protein
MSRFVDVNGVRTNVDFVESFWQAKDGELRVYLRAGDVEKVPPKQAGLVLQQLSGEDHVVQVFPAAFPVYAVYRNEDEGGYFADPVYYLALCADGYIRGVECCDGWFDTISESGNCEGLYPEDQLDQFPGLGKGAGDLNG